MNVKTFAVEIPQHDAGSVRNCSGKPAPCGQAQLFIVKTFLSDSNKNVDNTY